MRKLNQQKIMSFEFTKKIPGAQVRGHLIKCFEYILIYIFYIISIYFISSVSSFTNQHLLEYYWFLTNTTDISVKNNLSNKLNSYNTFIFMFSFILFLGKIEKYKTFILSDIRSYTYYLVVLSDFNLTSQTNNSINYTV